MANDSMQDWRLLESCQRHGSISSGSEQLDIDPATAGRILERLESQVGMSLFVHRARPFRLTSDGRDALDRMLPVLASYDQALREVTQNHDQLRGLIRLSSAGGFANRMLVPELMAFIEIHPEINFDVSIACPETDLERDLVDVCLISGPPKKMQDIVCLWRDHSVFIPVASPAYLAAHGTPREPADLRTHTGFSYTGPVRTRSTFMESGGRFVEVRWGRNIPISDILAVKNAVLDGYGIAIDMPILHCHEEIERGALVPILDGWRVPPKDNYAITTREKYKSRRIRTFMDWFVERSARRALNRDRYTAMKTGLNLGERPQIQPY